MEKRCWTVLSNVCLFEQILKQDGEHKWDKKINLLFSSMHFSKKKASDFTSPRDIYPQSLSLSLSKNVKMT